MTLKILSQLPRHVFRAVTTPLAFSRSNSTATNAAPRESAPVKPLVKPRRRRTLTGHGSSIQGNRVQRKRFFDGQKAIGESRILEKYQTRSWESGDVYAPHDLSAVEMRKNMKRQSPSADAFDALRLNPVDLYKNFSVMSEYMTSMGRIKHRSQTGLRPVNQRRMAKAIRRAIGLGLMPSVHRHPCILAEEARMKVERSGGGSAGGSKSKAY